MQTVSTPVESGPVATSETHRLIASDKVEGTALAADGRFYVVTDNDGIEDATGETRFIRLGKLFD